MSHLSPPQFLEHDNLRVAYYTAGNPEHPALFLIHGFCMTAETNWVKTDWIDKLINHFHVITLDIRGHGESDKPHDPAAYPASVMATDVVAIADKLGIERFSLIGYSMGARMSTFIASAHPERVEQLVIAGQAESLINGIDGTDAIAMALRAKDLKAIKHPKLRQFRMLAEMGNNDLEALACCIDAPSPPITTAHLNVITANTLVIVGQEDAMAGDPHAVVTYFPNAVASHIAGCNHFTALTNIEFIDTAVNFVIS